MVYVEHVAFTYDFCDLRDNLSRGSTRAKDADFLQINVGGDHGPTPGLFIPLGLLNRRVEETSFVETKFLRHFLAVLQISKPEANFITSMYSFFSSSGR